jgi:hypothetical protein
LPNPAFQQAIVAIPGSDRNANDIFYDLVTAATQEGYDQQTIILSLHFECPDDSPAKGDAYWNCGGADWAHGYADISGAKPPLSLYAVMDKVVTMLADKSTFPNLTTVFVTGLSAGGQFTQRYAAFNGIDPVTGVHMQYVVLSPSSYVYLDANRLQLGATCLSSGGCSGPFVVPSSDGCTGYDNYWYGLEERSGYVGLPGAMQVTGQYVSRAVQYYVGSEDTLANAAGTGLDTSCEANTQGIDRVARAVNAWNCFHIRFGATHPLTIVPGCMHSSSCMYWSPELRALFFPEMSGDVSSL